MSGQQAGQGAARAAERRANRQVLLASQEGESISTILARKRHGAGAGSQAAKCQRCLQSGHWTYECKSERVIPQSGSAPAASARQGVAPPPEVLAGRNFLSRTGPDRRRDIGPNGSDRPEGAGERAGAKRARESDTDGSGSERQQAPALRSRENDEQDRPPRAQTRRVDGAREPQASAGAAGGASAGQRGRTSSCGSSRSSSRSHSSRSHSSGSYSYSSYYSYSGSSRSRRYDSGSYSYSGSSRSRSRSRSSGSSRSGPRSSSHGRHRTRKGRGSQRRSRSRSQSSQSSHSSRPKRDERTGSYDGRRGKRHSAPRGSGDRGVARDDDCGQGRR